MTRRTALSLAALPALAAPPASRWPVSIFSKHLQWLPIGEAAVFAKQLGFEAIDLTVRNGGHVEPEQVETGLPAAAEAIRKAGLEITMITTAIGGISVPQTPAIFKTMRALGIKYYRWGGMKYVEKSSVKEQIATLRPMVKTLADKSAEQGVCGIYHTHSGLGEFGASIWDILAVVDGLDPAAVGINYDIGHATVEGGFGGWVNSFRAAGPYVRGVALKDFKWEKNAKGQWRPEWCPLGDGMVDWSSFAQRLKGTTFNGPLQLHYEYPMGGAEHGDRQVTWAADRIANAMRRDLERVRGYLAA